MEPLCEICQSRHHPNQAHRWPEKKTATQAAEAVMPAAPSVANTPAVAVPKRWKTREEYNAYMREKMRAYRARKRG